MYGEKTNDVNTLFFVVLLSIIVIFITKTLLGCLCRQQNMEAAYKLSNEETTPESKPEMPVLQVRLS